MTISKGAIQLRAIEPNDTDLIFEWENNKENWLVSNTLTPFSRYVISKYIETAHEDIFTTKQLRLMIDVCEANHSRTIGTVDLFDFDPFNMRAGVGILIADAKDRNKGFAYLALNEIISYSFNTLLLHQLYCNIGANNEASINLFKKAGFKVNGLKKSWLRINEFEYADELFLQLINS